jgi:hypothetical protein
MATPTRMPHSGEPLERPDTPAQWYALVAGTFLLALGIVSLALEPVRFGAVGSPPEQPEFLVWTVSGWSMILWIAGGGLGLLAAMRLDSARDFGLGAGIVFGVAAVWAFVDGGDVASLISADRANTVTHAAVGGAGLLVAVLPRSIQRPREAAVDTPPASPAPRPFEFPGRSMPRGRDR